MHEKAEGREKERLKKEEREVGALIALMLFGDGSLSTCKEGVKDILKYLMEFSPPPPSNILE